MIEGRPIKYGETTTLRLEIPSTWDVLNLTEVVVSVTNYAGTEVDTGTATIYTATTLGAASSAHASSITLEAGSADLAVGDRIRIGSVDEIGEVREVFSYDTLVAQVVPELEFAHADGADVVGMFATYDLDLSDTSTFTIGTDLLVRWQPDTQDLEAVDNFVVGVTAFSTGDLWSEFENTYPTEYDRIQGRDLPKFEKFVKRSLKLKMLGKGLNIDKIATTEYLQQGMIYLTRQIILEPSGDNDQVEYDRAKVVFENWLDDVSKLPMWVDDDQDEAVDADEGEVRSYRFCERYRCY